MGFRSTVPSKTDTLMGEPELYSVGLSNTVQRMKTAATPIYGRRHAWPWEEMTWDT